MVRLLPYGYYRMVTMLSENTVVTMKTIWDNLQPFYTIQEYMGLCENISNNLGLFQTILDNFELF